MESLLAILIIVVFAIALAFLYKKRASVAKWLNDPDMVDDNEMRKRRLRRTIEDCEYKLQRMENNEKEE